MRLGSRRARRLLLSYVIGALPIPWLVGRVFLGVDLRRSGTGTAGAANLGDLGPRWLVAPVGVAQILQGALPPLLARRAGEPTAVQALAGLAGVAAQDWNLLLGLKGGRGLTHSIGVLLALAPEALVSLTIAGVAGRRLGQVPVGMLAGFCLAPVVARAMGRPRATVAACWGLAGLAAAKRLEANGRPLPSTGRAGALIRRLLLDRDIADREAWLG
jgi:glycerol-3-phosphate acyltransferase PlsY